MSAANNTPLTCLEQIDIDCLDIEVAVVPSPNGNSAEASLVTDQLTRLEASQLEPEVRDPTEIPQTRIDALNQATAEQQRCSFCFENIILSQLARLQPCGHEFHVLCAETWTRRRNTCSYCKQTIDSMAINFSVCPINGQTFESRSVDVPGEEIEPPSIMVVEGVFIYSFIALPFYDIVTVEQTVYLFRGNGDTVVIDPQTVYTVLAFTGDMVIRVGVEEYPLAPFIQALRQQRDEFATDMQNFVSGLFRVARRNQREDEIDDRSIAYENSLIEEDMDYVLEVLTNITEERRDNVDHTVRLFEQQINDLRDPGSPVQQFPRLYSTQFREEFDPEVDIDISLEGMPDLVDTIYDRDSMEANPPSRTRSGRPRNRPSVRRVEEVRPYERIPRHRQRTRQNTNIRNASNLTRPIRSRPSRVTRTTTAQSSTRTLQGGRRQQENLDEENVRRRPQRRRRDNN